MRTGREAERADRRRGVGGAIQGDEGQDAADPDAVEDDRLVVDRGQRERGGLSDEEGHIAIRLAPKVQEAPRRQEIVLRRPLDSKVDPSGLPAGQAAGLHAPLVIRLGIQALEGIAGASDPAAGEVRMPGVLGLGQPGRSGRQFHPELGVLGIAVDAPDGRHAGLEDGGKGFSDGRCGQRDGAAQQGQPGRRARLRTLRLAEELIRGVGSQVEDKAIRERIKDRAFDRRGQSGVGVGGDDVLDGQSVVADLPEDGDLAGGDRAEAQRLRRVGQGIGRGAVGDGGELPAGVLSPEIGEESGVADEARRRQAARLPGGDVGGDVDLGKVGRKRGRGAQDRLDQQASAQDVADGPIFALGGPRERQGAIPGGMSNQVGDGPWSLVQAIGAELEGIRAGGAGEVQQVQAVDQPGVRLAEVLGEPDVLKVQGPPIG